MTCRDVQSLLSEHIDGVLSSSDENRLQDHLAKCDACRSELDALRDAVRLIRRVKPVEPPPDLLPRIHAKLARTKTPGSRIVSILWNPQARVAIAACLLVTVCAVSYRYIEREQLAPSAAPTQAHDGRQQATAPDTSREADEEIAERSIVTSSVDAPAESKRDTQVTALRASKTPTARRAGALTFGASLSKNEGDAERRSAPVPQIAAARAPAAPPTAIEANGSALLFAKESESQDITKEDMGPAVSPVADTIASSEKSRVVRGKRLSMRAQPATDAVTMADAKAAPRQRNTESVGLSAARKASRNDVTTGISAPTVTVASDERQRVLDTINAFALTDTPKAGSQSAASRPVASMPATKTASDTVKVRIQAKKYDALIRRLRELGKVTARMPPAPLGNGEQAILIHVRIVRP